METVSAGEIAEIMRRHMGMPPRLERSRYTHDDGPLFRRDQRAALKNGSRMDSDLTPPEDADDRVSIGDCALNGESKASLADLPCSDYLDADTRARPGFHVEAPEETALTLDHGPWSLGYHEIPPRSGRNLDLEKRSRAKLREKCRHNPDVFALEVPPDVWSRVTISDKIAEELALLDGAIDERKLPEWLTAPVDEPVVLRGYQPPKPRLRGRLLPGIAITGADDGVVLVLLYKDRALPPYAGQRRNCRAH
jgi:hypothetical protein